MAMRTIILVPRMFLHSVRPLPLFHQLPRTGYIGTSELSRGFCFSRVSQATAAGSSKPKDDNKPHESHGYHESHHKTIEEMVSHRIEEIKSGKFDKMKDPQKLKHFRAPPSVDVDHSTDPAILPKDGATTDGNYTLPHPIWSDKEVHSVKVTHKSPKGIIDWLAYFTVRSLRKSYDLVSGYNRRTRDEALWLNRIVFLETVAGVPGMVAAMVRHLHSLRKMRRDHGWIHTLLEEAENERMHLMTALQLKQPSLLFRATVLMSQGLFVTWFGIAYMISPQYCHRFVGYLEEEAVYTYTKCLKDIEDGPLSHWKTKPAPLIAITYWNLHPTATMKDVILAIRADEAHHRVVNHTLASMKKDDFNPYKPGE